MPDDIDITQDLVDGSDGALADTGVVTPNGTDATQALPDGVVHTNAAPSKDTTQEFSLRDQLSSAFKVPEDGDQDKTKTTTEQTAEVPPLTKDSEGKYRQSDGTFASKEQIEAFEAAQAAPAQTEKQPEEPAYITRMTPVEREQYQALPEEIRQFVGRTMEAVDSQAARFGEYGLIEQDLIGPRRQAWAQNGVTPAVALNQLFALSDFATRSPKDFVLWFAEQNQVDLDEALDERDAQATANPELRVLQGQVQQLQAQLNGNATGQQEAQQQARLNEVQTFSLEKDEAGGLKRPYLTDIMDTWPAHIQALRTSNPTMPNVELLQKAYEAACWANPNVRGRMQQQAQQKAKEDAQRKVEAARLAGSSINGASAGVGASTQQQPGNLGIRETIAAAFAQHAN